jgi:hypothetical protein
VRQRREGRRGEREREMDEGRRSQRITAYFIRLKGLKEGKKYVS